MLTASAPTPARSAMTTASGRALRPRAGGLAVVDVDAGVEVAAAGGGASRRPALAEQLVHVAAHPLDVDQHGALSGHRRGE